MKRVFLSIGVSLVSVAATGHDTWLLPSSRSVAPGSSVTLDLTSGMDFPAPEVPVKPDRMAGAHCRLAGVVVDISKQGLAEKSLQLKLQLEKPGVATIWAESKPRTLDLKPAEVKEYLEEIGAADTAGKEWERSPEPRKWRETYTKHAKTFVRVGSSSDGSWAEPAGMDLEIVPENDPTALRIGDRLSLRVLRNGQPLADFPLAAVASGETKGSVTRTDSAGRVSFPLGRKGWWLVKGTDIHRSGASGAEWESRFTTLTVFVEAK